MATPFDLPQARPNTDSVTEPQLVRAIQPMLADRDWQGRTDQPKFVERVAVINTALYFAQLVVDGDALALSALDIVLVDPTDLVVTFNQLMDHLRAAAVADECDATLWTPLTKQGASKLIDWLGSCGWANTRVSKVEEANVAKAKAAVAADAAETESPEGFWSMPNASGTVDIYKVQIAVHGSGHPYAKKLNTETGKFEMASGAYRTLLRSGHKLTL
jgi:hypothetical protein